jgi:hypothetical protein
MFLYEARQRVFESKKLLEKRGEDFEKARYECASAQHERSRLQGFHKNVHEKAVLAKLLSISHMLGFYFQFFDIKNWKNNNKEKLIKLIQKFPIFLVLKKKQQKMFGKKENRVINYLVIISLL